MGIKMDRSDILLLLGIVTAIVGLVYAAGAYHVRKEQECFDKGGVVFSRGICYPPSAVIKM
jgi:hypothetical protein